ncbi:P-loop containing nucleoside triphosphate hydrolase protein [Pholiota conissans]|uniref:DNA 3'-5' helicase n=1 Tax=Pholiota conissans TaxID=109636 RepID=A0A9P6CUV7_9AGAR|nr:P-loop containing nucleoside triphosphate hydrolase protein [Pholiota conissans]
MPIQSKVQQYSDSEINLLALSEKSWEVLGKRPFRWQLEAAEAILYGKDVILDVGTGCGKSLCFILPLLMNKDDMALTVSPLSALMLDQANSSKIPTVAVCQETTSRVGTEQMYKDIVNRKFRQVIVSPEIATSTEFLRDVLSQNRFSESIRLLNIDEAHCMNIWGGSFRPDYAKLGILRGRFKGHVATQIASATFPEHVLNDFVPCNTPKNFKADLRFIIPVNATKASDIPITLVYCNKRKDTEECVDRMREWAVKEDIDPDCIVFYHALIGEKRKRKIEELLGKGDIRVLFCTEALGMGCDLEK